ncbi:MAG: hypothetical protein ASARMPREDX12_006257 [Alectoria sarmentosa]|nr:MAG: hypothetical protein ASARMPREDX12_006257 [Alectoria sarmentosa]
MHQRLSFVDRLPPELADKVCSYLPRSSDIANIRLVSRFWNNVATPRLLPTVHLIFHPDSFERLAAISRHPVISQHVTHLFYEPDALAVYEPQRDWNADILSCDLPIKAPAVPAYGAVNREYLAYQCARVKHAQDPCLQLRRDERDRGYIEYQRLFSAQDQLRKQDFGALVFLDAFSRLPKLVSISTSLGGNPMPGSPYLLAKFKAGLLHPYGDLVQCHPTAPELESLSIAFDYRTNDYATQLKHIVCDHHWPNLVRVEFGKIDATQADFAEFFTRHASTLRHLGLRAIRLVEQCQWVPTLEMVQKTLSLDTATLGLGIYCEDPPQYWPLEANVFEYDDDENAQGNITRKALSNYLVHGGCCPLLDEERHPNQGLPGFL